MLRHSFISYRIANVKSADQVALEAGNSPAIIFKHYRELTTEEQAKEWFGIVPKEGQWENTYTYDWQHAHGEACPTARRSDGPFNPRANGA